MKPFGCALAIASLFSSLCRRVVHSRGGTPDEAAHGNERYERWSYKCPADGDVERQMDLCRKYLAGRAGASDRR